MILEVLTDKQIARIHDASLAILGTVGVRIPHAGMRARFRAAGAQVDEDREVVLIPERLVQEALASAGKTFILYGRDRARQACFGQGTRNYNSTGGQALWLSDDSRERRYACLDDVALAARLVDGLPAINIAGAMAEPHEVPTAYRVVEVVATLLQNTTKPLHFFFHNRAATRYVLEIFAAIAGSEADAARYPLAYPFLEPISPLKFPYEGIEVLFETARLGLPVPVGPMAQVGATAPGTLAGTLAQENAEILAGLCVTQLVKPGLPVCYGGIPHAFDMRTSQIIFGGPEQSLLSVAMAQLGRHYGLPVYVNVGLTDSKAVDAQAGLEAGISLMNGALAGADIFGHLGICGADQGASPVMLVLQHELIGYIERILRGFEVSNETLGLDVIRSVDRDGTYLAEPHTVRHFRKELWFPRLLDRQFWSAWVEAGAETLYDRCVREKDRVLAEHHPAPLDRDTQREIDKILATARRELG